MVQVPDTCCPCSVQGSVHTHVHDWFSCTVGYSHWFTDCEEQTTLAPDVGSGEGMGDTRCMGTLWLHLCRKLKLLQKEGFTDTWPYPSLWSSVLCPGFLSTSVSACSCLVTVALASPEHPAQKPPCLSPLVLRSLLPVTFSSSKAIPGDTPSGVSPASALSPNWRSLALLGLAHIFPGAVLGCWGPWIHVSRII